jgi:aryl-alcohol dehydrogenase-like predicted oxidoreductase
MAQLKKNIDALSITLSVEVPAQIDVIHAQFTNPVP